MKKIDVEDTKKVLEFTKAIQSSAAEEVGEMLRSTMQVKREQESSEAAASEAGLTRGNVYNNTLSDTIELDPPSLTQNSANLNDIPLNIVYTNLEKALPPTKFTKTSTKTKPLIQMMCINL